VGVQDQFQAKRPPKTYRYDSSLDPTLSWDAQRERALGEWLLGLIERAAKEGEAAVFAQPQEWKGGGVRLASTVEAVGVLKSISKPFLDWAGKAERHQIDVPTLPLFVHERHSAKAILDGIRHRKAKGLTLDLFGDPEFDIRDRLEAYEHKGPWQNRMILGDSLTVMNSLLEYEGLGGQVQMIYIDPPYGVTFGSNFQPFVRKRDVKHADDKDMTREPEMVKAYRDTWELGVHSYLTHLRDRMLIARELLNESGSIFVQISNANLHHVREILDEVFEPENFISVITFVKSGSLGASLLPRRDDYLLWYARDKNRLKYRQLYEQKSLAQAAETYNQVLQPDGKIRRLTNEDIDNGSPIGRGRVFRYVILTKPGPGQRYDVNFEGKTYSAGTRWWGFPPDSMDALISAGRVAVQGNSLASIRFLDDFPCSYLTNVWSDTATGSAMGKLYVVQTNPKVIQRCMLMTSDPGDLVLDPTCGSGTTAHVAEQWGRRWITIDTSRVPLALARQRLLTSTFRYYDLRAGPSAHPAASCTSASRTGRARKPAGLSLT
jgi:adenine-specific DNA-methyltransferase